MPNSSAPRTKPKRQYQVKASRPHSPIRNVAPPPPPAPTIEDNSRHHSARRDRISDSDGIKGSSSVPKPANETIAPQSNPDAEKPLEPSKASKSAPAVPVSPVASTINDQSQENTEVKASQTLKASPLPLSFPATTLAHFNSTRSKLVASRAEVRAGRCGRLENSAAQNSSSISFHISKLEKIDHNAVRIPDSPVKSADLPVIAQEPETAIDTLPVPEIEAAIPAQEPPTIPKENKPVPNWAAFLHTSNPPAKISAAPKPKVTANEAHGPNTATTSSAATPGATPVLSDSAQPLGILLLRVMYDPAYLIVNLMLPQFKIHVRGLTNTGNICYMNAVLQVLLYCEPFNRLLHLIKTKTIGSLDKQSHSPLLDATIKFFSEFRDDDTPSVHSPDKYYQTLINHDKFQHIKWGQQEDAEEFLGYFLDGLNDEFLGAMRRLTPSAVERLILQFQHTHTSVEASNQFKKNVEHAIHILSRKNTPHSSETSADTTVAGDGEWKEVAGAKKVSVKRSIEVEPTPITMLFGGQFRLELTIPKSSLSASIKSVTLDPFQHVQLDISECKTLEDALLRLNITESISYKGKNDLDMVVKKQTFIDMLPPILVVHLKRFSFLKEQELGVEKLLHQVVYTHQLNVPQQVLSGQAQVVLHTYTLMGIVYHIGANAEGGHYTSDVRATDGKWNRIDDTNITQVSADDVLESQDPKTAYILFYVRQ